MGGRDSATLVLWVLLCSSSMSVLFLRVCVHFQKEEKMKVADAMVTQVYNDSDCIIHQGDLAEYFYIVISGSVVVRRRGDDPVSCVYFTCGINNMFFN